MKTARTHCLTSEYHGSGIFSSNILRVTGPFWGEFLGHRWIPLPKTSDAELWCSLWSAPEQMVEQTIETPVIWDATALIMTSLKCLDRFLDMADKTYFFCLSTSTQIHESTWSVLLHFNQLWIFPCRNSSARVANTAGEEVMGSDKSSITNYSSFFNHFLENTLVKWRDETQATSTCNCFSSSYGARLLTCTLVMAITRSAHKAQKHRVQ